MQLAFVIRLGNGTRPAEGLFEGRVEEVDSCAEQRFRSTEELLKFLGERFDLAMAAAHEAGVNKSDEQGAHSKRDLHKG